ncbi:MAG: hypothetical protein Kow00104_08980 [Rhodothalassiaceae bacterium]
MTRSPAGCERPGKCPESGIACRPDISLAAPVAGALPFAPSPEPDRTSGVRFCLPHSRSPGPGREDDGGVRLAGSCIAHLVNLGFPAQKDFGSVVWRNGRDISGSDSFSVPCSRV